ncbi:phage tail tape measure protein [Streptomyces sp. NPDC008125]|uniref:phage tail tape measure protein n=1 Tax=Streptomyces sp. NPDC008125 TaxID=3364811 RepID=UPI0036EA93E2
MPVEVGVGYVSVVPETRGFGAELQRQISGPSGDAGQRAGRESGQGFLGGIGGALKTGIAGVAAVGAVLFTKGFTDSLDQGKIAGKLSAQLDSTAKDAERNGKLAGKLYAKAVVADVETGAAAIKGIMQQGLLPTGATEKQITRLGTRLADVSTILDEDLGRTSRAVGTMIKTGLVDTAGEALDVLARGTQAGVNVAEDLLDTYAEYPTQFRKLGLSAASSMGLLSQGLKAGARDADTVADTLKEFSIRAVDGSKTSATAYGQIGLNAERMTAKIAKGGKYARSGLQEVLDGLRAIDDPVKREAAAVGLFGTKAEDMGSSLYSLNLTTAEKGLGKIAGAADRAGTALRDNAGSKIDIFRRSVMQGITNAVGKYAVPAVERLADVANRSLVPAVRETGQAVRGAGEALAGGVRWTKEYGAWLLPLAVGVAGVTLTMNASAIATGAVTAVFSVYRGVILATAAVTRGYAVAQGVLNAVMEANPIGLIITGVAALAALIFVAYKRSDTFRSIVQATWSGIQSGWSSLWSVLQPGVSGFVTGLRAIGTGAVWLWGTVLAPTFGFIGTAAKVLGVVVATLLIAPFVIGFKAVGAIASWLWGSQIKPAFEDIATGAVWLWGSALQPVLGWIWSGLRATGAGAMWLYRSAVKPAFDGIGTGAAWLWGSAIKPAFDGIGAGAAWLWGSGIKPAFTGIQSGVRMTGSAATWLYRSAVKPAFDGIGTGAAWLWDVALRPALDKGRAGVKLFGAAFGLARDAIGSAWSEVKDIAKEPVNFIIKHVYTEGIKATWDKVADFVGVGKLPAAPKLLAGGGRTYGGVPGKDSIPALMMADEFVVKRSSARSVGFDTLRYINEHGELPVQRFADGGIVGDLWGAAKKVGGAVLSGADFLTDPGKMWDKATGFIRDKAAAIGSSPWAKALGHFPAKMLDGLKDKIVDAAGGLFGGSGDVGGSGVERWSAVVLQALKMVGQPASLLSVVLRRMNQESGGNPRAINNWDINAKNGDPSRGLMQTIGATFNAYAGPLRSRGIYDPLANVYASMRYALSTYGSLASAYNRPGGYADGGRPKRGELAWVGERGPELVRFGGGDTEVYDHLTSLRMAGGLGVLRGFAKGTKVSASTKARREVPGDLAAFRKSLTGTAAQIAAASNALAADLKAAGGAGKTLATATTAASARLQSLAKQRDTVASKIATAKAAAADQATSATDYLGLGNISNPTSVGGLISGLQARQSTLKSFQAQIATASKRGVSQSLISQLVAAGPDSQLAGLVAGASAGQIKQLNALAASGAKLSTSYGRTMADAMYDAGTMAGKGFLTGLQAQEAALQKEMTRLGGTLVTAIERRLQIHSPSRETDRVGRMVGAGLIGGMVSTLPAVDRASVRMATASVPAPAAATRTAAQPAGLQHGQPLALVLADGTQLDAYVDTRVDAGMTTVRQRSRAGTR